jgi:hypothetical protein
MPVKLGNKKKINRGRVYILLSSWGAEKKAHGIFSSNLDYVILTSPLGIAC